MIDREALLKELKSLTSALIDDLRGRTDEVDAVSAAVRAQYRIAREAGRTDRSYEEWREDLLAQIAVAWVLASTFVRFCEDNGLYDTPLLSGVGERRGLAGDHRADWLAANPAEGDRGWFLEVFRRYRELPGMRELLGEHNPLWQFGPTDDGARKLRELLQSVDPASGELVHDFTDADLDTRFLGDLYQDLSDHARKTYALLQTPDFVEEFILDRTLDPAIETFGLAETKMIDPTCGSGHFLLGAFERIFERWRRKEPGTSVRELVQRTLDAVNGVDLNPFAVAVARFRLLVAALKASGIRRLKEAPNYHFRIAVGDSLIHGTRSGELFAGAEGFSELLQHRYPSEDGELANEILKTGSYQAVVGNPPYITVKEPALRNAYRAIYRTAFRKYSLVAPFTERFWDLALSAKGSSAGYVGFISAKSFATREYGKRLVEKWLPSRDLTLVVDSSVAEIPHHDTPTVMLFGRSQRPAKEAVTTILGIRSAAGSGTGQADPAWRSIVKASLSPQFEDRYVSRRETPRNVTARHPWSLKGGAAPGILRKLESSDSYPLGHISESIGFFGITGVDDLFLVRPSAPVCREGQHWVPVVDGYRIRNWVMSSSQVAFFPYEFDGTLQDFAGERSARFFWPYRHLLRSRRTFSGQTYQEAGIAWWAWHQLSISKLNGSNRLSFAEVATENHFAHSRSEFAYNRTGPIVVLNEGADRRTRCGVAAVLNCSTANFWTRNRCSPKNINEAEPFRDRYQRAGTKLQKFPIPSRAPTLLGVQLEELSAALSGALPVAALREGAPNAEAFAEARATATAIRARMVALQEELDWQCYHLYGLTGDDLRADPQHVPDLNKGERAFEIVLARRMASGEVESTWFERHGSTPITELPDHWSPEYRRVVEARIALIESDRSIRLLERPEHKRRWNWDSWRDLEQEALRSWLLDRMESPEVWSRTELQTAARLADHLRRDPDVMTAVELLLGRPDFDLTKLVTDLAMNEAVPFEAGYRFKQGGLRRLAEWEKVWELQRREDAIDARTELAPEHPDALSKAEADALKAREGLDRIPVPPKYRKSDYASGVYYRLRGKLDVPQERFISYPDTHIGADTTPVLGWAGWDHLQRTQALASHYSMRQSEAADSGELTALLAGLDELVPWLKQWHNELDPQYGQRMGDYFASFVETQARSLGLSLDELRGWTP
ncbi:BREX-2 system adenine-specific DNA-methyltransferase PglX [Gemmatimonadota bacterium Y43]|uniref:BREX-2 system adenine-specific DNA-methyltransferase PglX n=1 Tax=Gaopeijia maritima TaxID=3119007 RepID=UPI0032805E26